MGDDDARRPEERDRLERFASAFEHVDPRDDEPFWDQLEPPDRDVLLVPWARLAEQALDTIRP